MILASCKGQGIILILLSKGKDRSLLQVRRLEVRGQQRLEG